MDFVCLAISPTVQRKLLVVHVVVVVVVVVVVLWGSARTAITMTTIITIQHGYEHLKLQHSRGVYFGDRWISLKAKSGMFST